MTHVSLVKSIQNLGYLTGEMSVGPAVDPPVFCCDPSAVGIFRVCCAIFIENNRGGERPSDRVADGRRDNCKPMYRAVGIARQSRTICSSDFESIRVIRAGTHRSKTRYRSRRRLLPLIDFVCDRCRCLIQQPARSFQ